MLYATCSLLKSEGEAQADWICRNYPAFRLEEMKRTHPEKDECDALFPGLTASADWFYWPTPDRAEVRIQYPMSSHHRGAPGTSKTSEFTATTYAYIMSVKC